MGTNVLIQGAGGGGVKLAPLNNPASASEVLNGKELYDDTGTKIIGSYSATLPTLNPPTISVSGDQITITNPASNGNFVLQYYIFLNGLPHSIIMADHNTYTFTGLDDGIYYVKVRCRGTNFNDSADSNIEAMTISTAAPIYGVSALYSSATTCTRTDDAVGMTYSISNGEVVSDFDNVFPWNEATVETIDNNKFLHMPDMWFRVATNNNYITSVAVSKRKGDTGNWYKVDSFYYGCYGGSRIGTSPNQKLASISGETRFRDGSLSTIRDLVKKNGSGYFNLDLYHHTVMLFLWLIEFANKDSNSVLPGNKSGTLVNTGGTDSISTPSGYNISTNQMRYHYIEDFVGNAQEYVDGMMGAGSGSYQYVSADPSLYTSLYSPPPGYETLSWNGLTGSGNCLIALGWDDNLPFLVMPISKYSNSYYNTYFCSYAGTSNGSMLRVGADSSSAGHGLFRYNANNSTNIQAGGRLLYKPAT